MQNKINFIFKSPNKSPGFLLNQLHLIWQRKIKKVLDPLDLTHTQFVLLASIAWLTNEGDSITQIDIAELNNYDRMMVSKVLRTLQNKKLILRQEHKTDTRAKTVNLTAEGREILQLALSMVENADIDFFASLENNISDFNDLMQTVIRNHKGN